MKRGPVAVVISRPSTLHQQEQLLSNSSPPPFVHINNNNSSNSNTNELQINSSDEFYHQQQQQQPKSILKTSVTVIPANVTTPTNRPINNNTINSSINNSLASKNEATTNNMPTSATTRTVNAGAAQPRSKSQVRYRRGISLLSLNGSASNNNLNQIIATTANNNNSNGNSSSHHDVMNLREALLRHDSSLSRAGVAVNHLQPVDRHALTTRAHFRPDPNVDALAQHLRWSTAKTSPSAATYNETEILAAARESYHPTAPPVPSMQISLKSIAKPTADCQQPSLPLDHQPNRPPPSPTLLLLNHQNQQKQQQRLVSIDNRPETSASASPGHVSSPPSSAVHQPQRHQSASSSLVPGAVELRKQFDLYKRGVTFLPQNSSTKYFYKPEHGWLVKSVRDRRTANNNNNSSSPNESQQLVSSSSNSNFNNNNNTAAHHHLLPAEMLSASLSISAMPPNASATPPPTSPDPSRASTTRLHRQQQLQQQMTNQQRLGLISATSSARTLPVSSSATTPLVHHVSVVDLGERDDADNPLKIMSVNVGGVAQQQHTPLRTSVMTRKLHQQNVDFVNQQQQQQQQQLVRTSSSQASRSVVALSSGDQQQPAMMVSSTQHPAAMRAKKLRDLFSSYDDFKRAAEDYANKFPALPQDLSASPYLNEAKQRQIWCWLHYGENISDVEYLLSVC